MKMDLVNSVTQNSNNRNTIMENQAINGDDDSKKGAAGSQYKSPESPLNAEMLGQGEEKRAQVPDYLRAIGMDPRKFWPKKYRFTREKSPGLYNPLTIAQRNFYESNGYIVLDDCVSRRLVEQVRLSKAQQLKYDNNNYTGSNTTDTSDFVDEFLLDKLLARNNRIAQYVKCFCDEKFLLMTNRFIENFQTNNLLAKDLMQKQAPNSTEASSMELHLMASNNRQALFRDWIYLPFRPIDKVVGTIVALEPIEHVILVVPGTHRVGQCTISSTLDNLSAAYETSQERPASAAAQVQREFYESSPGKLSTLVEKSRKGFKYVNLKPGQTLFYHPGLVHSFSNDLVNFKKRQLAAVAYYAAADCEFVDLRKSLSLDGRNHEEKQENQYDEQVPLSLAHFGAKNPRDYRSWLDKPRLVGDTKANL